jgi:FkbM family methyltransferase
LVAEALVAEALVAEALVAEFRVRLVSDLMLKAFATPVHNTDYLRFPTRRLKRLRRGLRARYRAALRRLGYVSSRAPRPSAFLGHVLERLDDFARTYARLADATSRDMFLAVLCFRALGPQRVTLPTNTPEYWKHVARLESDYLVDRRTVDGGPPLGALDRYRIARPDGPIEADLHALNVIHTFALEHYACPTVDGPIAAAPGDIVIDGGGCFGDTALYFADRVGAAGAVHVFDIVPQNLMILRANLARNPHLAKRIHVEEHALWDRSDVELRFDAQGAATRVRDGARGEPVLSLTIDDFVARRAIPRVDFIKLDIEGAELPALRGARETLRRFRPRLAISVYHCDDDMVAIPNLLAEVVPEYAQYLTHVTIHAEETVLFARPRA